MWAVRMAVPQWAVLMVGTGFHEVRGQSDDGMVAVFAEYARAGLLLMFTEESALSVDDLIETAWNTYHAGFKYVHRLMSPMFLAVQVILRRSRLVRWHWL